MPNNPTPLMEYDDGLDGCRGYANAILYTSVFAAAIAIALLIAKLLATWRIP